MKRLFLSIGCLFTLAACSTPASTADETVRIRWSRDPENLDPLVLPNPNAYEAINLLHCSLLTVDYTQKKFVPWLAQAMPRVQQQDSLLLVTYQLRPEATWDNGQPVLAQDVAFTLKVMNCPGLPNEAARAQYGFIEAIRLDSLDQRRFTLVLRGRAQELVQSSGDYPILPEYKLDPQGQLRPVALAALRADTARTNPRRSPAVLAFAERYEAAHLNQHPENLPGCGPYTLKEWQPSRYLLLQRKKTWWADRVKNPAPQLVANPTAISYEIIPDDATALLALRRGDIGVYPMVPARDFIQLRQDKAAHNLRFYTADSYDMITAGFNTRRSVLRDAATRQALSYLFDIPGLIQASQQGMAYPSVSLVNPQATAIYNDSLPLLKPDSRQAASLLSNAGWRRDKQGWGRQVGNGPAQRLELTFSYRTGDAAYEAIVLQFRTAAAQLGIPVRPQPLEASLFTKQLRAGETDMFLQLLSGNPFAYNFAPILHSQSLGWGNFTGFGTAASDQLIEAIATEADASRQARMLRKFQRLLRQESPMVVLFFLQYRLAAASNLTNLHATGIRPGYEAAAIRTRPVSPLQP
ncbi:ABC transporter substrate-binding protein [Hymenobacter persicinus]|uniref:ABC transporter substrate-binding protein n=1 Tax=Hymenobacter persicinus TaxID=2025506 RepID=A0A4Q5L777_9BACT|nr:ABC transporter substrate-binding protein [Hymenobacter persicinus]RYU76421.1 ABC transporter substrate-binding protein [Hymenobacter persicinus]